MLAHNQNELSDNAINVYDTDNGPVWQHYQNAVSDGADFIIGPLLKSRISELATSGQLQIPVLALNQIDDEISLSQPLYQFGLNPEDEAEQAAQRAFFDGPKRVVALVPESAWGERLLQAFTRSWHANGGILLAVERYPAKTTDFTQYITRALSLDKSKQRYKTLVQKLGREIEFEPRRRQDIDAVFIVAFPREARLIRPQLQFHRASDLPVYATSHIYTGIPNPDTDRDLNTIRFCDTPWTLGETGDSLLFRSEITELWQNRADHYQRLFALGIDAYRVIPRLDTLGIQGTSDFNGMTGNLFLDDKRRIHRRLECAIFKNGVPDNLGSMPELAPISNEPVRQPDAVIEWSTR
jgi:outer membrane PBP1 activator LpoA protein